MIVDAPSPFSRTSRILGAVFLCACAFAAILFHTYGLDAVPRGLYIDESSNAFNALSLLQHGYDEYFEFFPLFFRAINDYRGGVLNVVTALLFAFFGPSTYVLRMSSALFFLLYLFALDRIIVVLWRQQATYLLRAFTVLAAGFLPWTFVLSRFSHESIAFLACAALGILFVARTYFSDVPRSRDAVLAGLCIGISVYTYQPAKVFAPLFLLGTLLFFARSRTFRQSRLLLLSAAIAAIPFLLFSLQHSDANLQRFGGITYVFNNTPISEKIATFSDVYRQHWSPRFLLENGDRNPRHSVNGEGQVLWIVLQMFLFGCVVAAVDNAAEQGAAFRRRRFLFFLILNALLAPLAASLTNHEVPNALRCIVLAPFLILLACAGMHFVLFRLPRIAGAFIALLIMGILVMQTHAFLRAYFVNFPRQSEEAFESFPLEVLWQQAVELEPKSIYVTTLPEWYYVHVEFFRRIHPPHEGTTIYRRWGWHLSRHEDLRDSCILYYELPEDILQDPSLQIQYREQVDGVKMTCFAA